MTFKAENKSLNAVGSDALTFWEDNKNSVKSVSHESFRVQHLMNRYFLSKNMNAKAFNGTDPKTGNIAFLIYSGDDGDFDFEGRVLWVDGYEFGHLHEALNLLGITTHE